MIVWNQRERVADWVGERVGGGWGEWYQAIGLEDDGRLIAGIVYNFMTAADIVMHIATEPNARWLTSEFAHAVFGYPFNQLGKRRVSVYARSKDESTRKLVEALGFEHEGRVRHAYPDDDAELYGLLKEHCRYLQ